MKRVPRLFRPGQYSSGEDQPFRTAVPGSNEAASAFCGWRYRGQCGNRLVAQPETKAEFAALLYTAKRMITFFGFA